MRRVLTAMGVLAAILLSAGLVSAGTLAKSGSFERVVTIKAPGASATETEKYYWSGDRLRAEKYSIGGTLIQIKNGSTLYMYNPAAKEAMKATVPSKYNQTVESMLNEEAATAKGGKKVGAAKVAGFPCDVYIMSKTAGGVTRQAKLYMSRDSRLPVPLKLEITIGKTIQTIETRNIKLNISVSSSMFTVPKGTKIKEQKIQTAPAPKPSGKK